MVPSVAAKAQQGAQEMVESTERMLREMLASPGPRTRLSYSNSIYYLPIVLGYSAQPLERIGDLPPVIQQARGLLAQDPWLATLLAAEMNEAMCAAKELLAEPGKSNGTLSNPIADVQIRTWGVQMADGRMPGMALIIGSARSSTSAAALVRALRARNVLCLLAGDASGKGMAIQLEEEGVELGERAGIVMLGHEPTSAVHGVGFAARCAMRLGGHKPGTWSRIRQHSKRRTPGLVLALGDFDSQAWAMALAAQEVGFTVVTDKALPDPGEVVCIPFEEMTGKNDSEKAEAFVEKCIAARGMKVREYDAGVSIAYGPAFEDELIREAELKIQLGGKGTHAFELVQVAASEQIKDGAVEVIGPDPFKTGAPAPVDFGLVVRLAGKKLEADFEPYLERQIHLFLSYASGVEHTGSKDEISIRISKAAAAQGFTLESLGKILHARLHEEFPQSVQRVQVMFITEPTALGEWQAKAREAHEARDQRIAKLTDADVDEFYVCTNCRVFAPNNVSIISPERVSPCGQCNWLDARATFLLNAKGVRRPVKRGKAIDEKRGVWEGTNEYAKTASHGHISEVALYSIAQSPMCACGDFECMVTMIAEANGVMVLAHDDTSATPAGINVETFASIAAGEQIPGAVGVGKSHLLSPKFIAAEGGFKRVVWMSSSLKESMSEELRAVCEREGAPDLMEKIADERHVTSVEQLVRWLKEHHHPALDMEKMY